MEKAGTGRRVLRFLRVETRGQAARTVAGALLGAAFYMALYPLALPSYKVMGLVTVQIDPAIVAIPVAASFFGPLAGLLAGLIGAFGADALFTQQVIAFGLINLSYGLLGLVAGIPRYPKGFSSGRALAKVELFTMAGFGLMSLVYYAALVYVAHQNQLPTLLYNFLPFFTVSLITLFLLTPVAVWVIDYLVRRIRRRDAGQAPDEQRPP